MVVTHVREGESRTPRQNVKQENAVWTPLTRKIARCTEYVQLAQGRYGTLCFVVGAGSVHYLATSLECKRSSVKSIILKLRVHYIKDASYVASFSLAAFLSQRICRP